MSTDFDNLEARIEALLPPVNAPDRALQSVCDLLCTEVPHYDWVGFYFAVPRARLLVLGPFCGAPTEHTRIPYGRGICGQSAETLDAFVVPDVTAAENYLSCSVETRAELVVPVFLDDGFIAEIDIDSHVRDPFGPADEPFLRRIGALVAPHVPAVFDPAEFRDPAREGG